MACDPTTDLDDDGARAAGGRRMSVAPHVSAYADGELGTHSLAAGGAGRRL